MFQTTSRALHRSFRSLLLGAIALPAAAALAQPAGVTVTNLGDFSLSVNASITRTVVLSPATPASRVAWFKIRLPRIAAPHRFLDISTSGPDILDAEDTHIAIFAANGNLIASDDDDGASIYSALSFGITDPNAPTRLPPISIAGQRPPIANNGRDGLLSGSPAVGDLGTASDYYIVVTESQASFANAFFVRPGVSAPGLTAQLTIRMYTPSETIAPSIIGTDDQVEATAADFRARAETTGSLTSVTIDASAVGGAASFPLFSVGASTWNGFPAFVYTVPGVFPLVYRAANAIGDVAADQASVTVSPPAFDCSRAPERVIDAVPGTTLHTYSTLLGNVDGPWTSACYAGTPTGSDVWFLYSSATAGTLNLSTCNSDTNATGPQPDTMLALTTACGSPFFACGDDLGGCGFGTRLNNIPVVASEPLYIAVRAYSTEIVNGVLALTFTPAASPCDSIDFNNDTLFPADEDFIDFLTIYAGGSCSAGNTCNDIDFNNDGLFPSDDDIVAFLRVLAGGAC